VRPGLPLLIGLGTAGALACEDVTVEEVVLVDREEGCLACHRPVQPDGTALGIEEAHPAVDGKALRCVECHGGDPDSLQQSTAHVSPGGIGVRTLRDLTSRELDEVQEVNPDYLRFVNPGDFRAASRSCGAGSDRMVAGGGSTCHETVIRRARFDLHATYAGGLSIPRFRAGLQHTGLAVFGIKDARDPDFEVGQAASAVGELRRLEEPVLAQGEVAIGPFQDLYVAKACIGCHTWSFGENRFPGDFRSSGCSACHMVYADDGLSRSADPQVDKGAPPHPVRHELTLRIPTAQCNHCHFEMARIGPSYQGYRERGRPGTNPPNAVSLGVALHGHDADFYVADEDSTNDVDETPPDVHFEAGMACIDCHGAVDTHGDGSLRSDMSSAVRITCEDCHGSATQRADLQAVDDGRLDHLSAAEDGTIRLTRKLDGTELEVPQLADAVGAAADGSPMRTSHTPVDGGFDHGTAIACHTCHAGWLPSCYSCHVEVDMTGSARSRVSGAVTLGRVRETRGEATVGDLVLMLDSKGRIAPSMPAERLFLTVKHGSGEVLILEGTRTTSAGAPGMGQRAIQPHTIRRESPFGACDRCHPRQDGSNAEAVAITAGFGSDRFIVEDGQGRSLALDRLVDPDTGDRLVAVGHDEPERSRPLPAALVERMMGVQVP
jgi:hypothetical protein